MQTSTALPFFRLASKASQPVWFNGLLVLLALAPLPFGSNRPWASDLLGLLTGILLLILARDLYRQPTLWPVGAPWQKLGFAALSILAVNVWGCAQTLAWLPHPLWARASAALAIPLAGSISLTPDRFGECSLRIFTYAGCFLLAFVACRDAVRAEKMLRALSRIAAAYAGYGLVIQSSGLNLVLWYPKWAYWNDLTSSFINKNSYATYAGLGLLCCAGQMWRRFKRYTHKRFSIFSLERMSLKDLTAPAMCLTVFGALLLTSSRGGLTSACAGCLAFTAGLAVHRRWQGKKSLLIVIPAAAFLIGLASFGTGSFVDRIDPQAVQDDSLLRLNAYQVIARALADSPWQGYGLGGFDTAFRLYRHQDIHEWFEHAHDDYLELAVELGVPAALLYLAALAALISCCFDGIRRRRRHETYSLIGVSASVLVGAHSLIDFSMQIPAVAFTYAALLGMGVAQSWSSRHAEKETRVSQRNFSSATNL